MYNETYHPVNEVALNWMLAGESPEHQEIIKNQVQKSIQAGTRNYLISLPDGTNYQVMNGIVIGSKGYRG